MDSVQATYYFNDIWSIKNYQIGLINYISKGYNLPRRTAINIINSVVRGSGDDVFKFRRIIASMGLYKPLASRPQERSDITAQLLDGKAISSYLDYGCGDGSITQYIGNATNATHVYGVDIVKCTKVKQVETSELANSSIDLVTAFVSLHHVEGLHETLLEISRICAPDGMLIIREHDFDGSDAMYAYLQLIHIFAIVRDDTISELKALQNTQYRSYTDWNRILATYGFEFKKMIKYDCNNTQGLYYASYVKK